MSRLVLFLSASIVLLLSAQMVAAADFTVEARPNNRFSPENLTIQPGDSVTWTNAGGFHNVRAMDGSFRCADGCDGQGGDGDPSTAAWSFTLTFDNPGTIDYECEVHGSVGMVGQVIVTTTGACVPDATTLCIDDQPGDRRWELGLHFESVLGGGISGDALAIPLSPLGVGRGGIFAFRFADNPEMLVKVLPFCGLNDHWSVFYAAATTVGFELTVTDTKNDVSKTYTNPDQTPAATVTDTTAFATCP